MPNQEKETLARLNETFRQWRADGHELGELAEELHSWMANEATARGNEEARQRLERLLWQLEEHFEKERKINELLACARGRTTAEIEATRRQAEKDHAQLTNRLRKLIEATRDAQQRAWSEIVVEFNLFIDVLEQHQDLEFENILCLMPSATGR